jgi:rhodanese-related sulfurtransferase
MNGIFSSARPPVYLQLAILLAATLACSIASQVLAPNRIPWIGSWENVVESGAGEEGIALVNLAAAHEIAKKQTYVIFDARKIADYEKGHLPGAFAIPHESIAMYFEPMIPLLVDNQPIMTYCAGKDCDEALELARYLRRNGYTNVVLFLGGFEEWDAAGLAVEGRKP